MTIGQVIEARRRAGRELRLYAEPDMLPTHWVGEDEDGSLWEFPALADGWTHRHAYEGERESLQPAPAHSAAGTGWPGLSWP